MLGGLEGGTAVAFSSGMAACAAVLGTLPTGAHVVLGEDCYQGVTGTITLGPDRNPIGKKIVIEEVKNGQLTVKATFQPQASASSGAATATH